MPRTDQRHDSQLIEQLRRHAGRPGLTDAEIEAELDQAWSDLRGSVASEDSLPEMTIRLAVTRLRSSAPAAGGGDDTRHAEPDLVFPAPTWW